MKRILPKLKFNNTLIIVIVMVLMALPVIFSGGQDFSGTDQKAMDMINQVSPEYKPWFHNIWTPPGSEVESLLFALQAALGSGFIGYYFGCQRCKRQYQENEKNATDR